MTTTTTEIYFYNNTDVEVTTFINELGDTFSTYEFIVNGKNYRAWSSLEAKTIIDANKK